MLPIHFYLPKQVPLREQGKNFAVVIGVSKYSDPAMPDLFYPIFDARKVADVITNFYTFDKKECTASRESDKGQNNKYS